MKSPVTHKSSAKMLLEEPCFHERKHDRWVSVNSKQTLKSNAQTCQMSGGSWRNQARLAGTSRVAWSNISGQHSNSTTRTTPAQPSLGDPGTRRHRPPAQMAGSHTARSAPSNATHIRTANASPATNRRVRSGGARRPTDVHVRDMLLRNQASGLGEADDAQLGFFAISATSRTTRANSAGSRSSRLHLPSVQNASPLQPRTKHEMAFLSMVLDSSTPREEITDDEDASENSRSKDHDQYDTSMDEIQAIERVNRDGAMLPVIRAGDSQFDNLEALSTLLANQQSVVIETGHGRRGNDHDKHTQYKPKPLMSVTNRRVNDTCESARGSVSNAGHENEAMVGNASKLDRSTRQSAQTRPACAIARITDRKTLVGPQTKSVCELRPGVGKLRLKGGVDDIMDGYSTIEEGENVDPEPILRYLTLVQSHLDVYTAMRQRRPQCAKEHDDSLIAVGKALGRPFGCSESLVVQAAYELGCWHLDPAWAKAVYDTPAVKKDSEAPAEDFDMVKYLKTPPQIRCWVKIPGLDTLKKEGKAKRKTEPLTINTKVPMSMRVSEFEKHRGDVERWIRTLSTTGFIKSREKALSIMQESDKSIRRWWQSHQNCRYLRKRKPGKGESAAT